MMLYRCLAVAVLCLNGQAQAEGLGPLLNRPGNEVVHCLMGSGLMEDAAMFISDRAVTVVGPGGWQVKVTGEKPSTAEIDTRDAAGRPSKKLRNAFQDVLDGCR